jgi:YHS domain-containing protein
MLRTFIVDIVFPLIFFLLLRSILRSIFPPSRAVSRQPAPSREPEPTVVAGGELKKDPVCGTYVSATLGLTRKVKGEVWYFCSAECRDKFVG